MRFRWLVGALFISYGFLLIVGFGVAAVTVGAIREDAILPYTFDQDIYDATPGELCPGDEFTHTITTTVQAETNVIMLFSWIMFNPRRVVPIDGSGKQYVFTDASHLSDYYRERFGREVSFNQFPLVISETITMTVPDYAEPGAMLLRFGSALDPRRGDEYIVPVWIKSESECL